MHRPSFLEGDGNDIVYEVTKLYSGPFAATAVGLAPRRLDGGTVEQDPNQTFVPGGPGTAVFQFDVPVGSPLARFDLRAAPEDELSDLDLFVVRDGEIVASSGSLRSDEHIDIEDPAPGAYEVWVHGYSTDGPRAPFTLSSWILRPSGAMTVTAPDVVTGGTFPITLSFPGLEPGTTYLGMVGYSGPEDVGDLGATIVTVTTP